VNVGDGHGFQPARLERSGRARLEARRARRRRFLAIGGGIALAAVILFIGIAFGRALEEAPRPGGSVTQVRTIDPGTLPAVTRTVTVTTSGE